MAQWIANPRVTFNIVSSNRRVGPDTHRALLIGQITSGATAVGGTLVTNVPRDVADINALFGASSHLAMIARAYREVNDFTQVDALPLADNSGGTAATATVVISGTATSAGVLYLTVVSDQYHRWEIDVEIGDTPSTIGTKIAAQATADRNLPFTTANATGTITFTAANKGTHANTWLLALEGRAAGITTTLTGWNGGATNPSLTTLFDPVQTLRYQTIVWPEAYTLSNIRNWIDARKNVNNDVMDGRAFVFLNQAFATIKSTASGLNSSELVLLTNEPTSQTGRWLGPHLPEASDVITAKFAAARDRRFMDGISVSDIVATNAPLDQFGGVHMASLPYFNTPLLGVGQPLKGTGYTFAEQLELENSGVTVLGTNRTYNAAILGQVVTTYLNDVAGNSDDTWKFLEWRDTHGVIREYFQRNCQKEYAQKRLTTGTAVAGYSMVDRDAIASFCALLYQELTQLALTVTGLEARKFFERNLVVTLVPERRRVEIAAKVPMVSQLGEITGVIEYTFATN